MPPVLSGGAVAQSVFGEFGERVGLLLVEGVQGEGERPGWEDNRPGCQRSS
ncbi:hypothetical protein [Streptomyces sp. KLOTTS4A1]|uniref:hypothetical protein n=1 Tax=Streptomyces sp. KLOTTS4A1 TaxID=3390996 RepID=UPI0039F55276